MLNKKPNLKINSVNDATIIFQNITQSYYKEKDAKVAKKLLNFSKESMITPKIDDDFIVYVNINEIDDEFFILKNGIGDLDIIFKDNIPFKINIQHKGVGDINGKTENNILIDRLEAIHEGIGDLFLKDCLIDSLKVNSSGVGDTYVSAQSDISGKHSGVGDLLLFVFDDTDINSIVSNGVGDCSLKKSKFKNKINKKEKQQKNKENDFSLRIIEEDENDENTLNIEVCSHCGFNINQPNFLIDSFYPMNRQRTKWLIGCMSHNGGCGRQVYADTQDAVIKKWNSGETSEFLDAKDDMDDDDEDFFSEDWDDVDYNDEF